jgi:hypothetical protein
MTSFIVMTGHKIAREEKLLLHGRNGYTEDESIKDEVPTGREWQIGIYMLTSI